MEYNEAEKYAEDLIGSFNAADRQDVADIKRAAKNLVIQVYSNTPKGRRQSIAMTSIETAAMYAVKSLFEG